MADQKSGDAAISVLLKTYYVKRMVERLEPETRLFQFGEKEPIPQGTGKTIEFTGYRNIAPILSNSNELSSSQVYISAYTISASLIQRHNYLKISNLVDLTSIDPRVEGAVDALADQMARTVELYLRSVVVGQVGTAARSSAATHGINSLASANNNNGTITGTSAQRTHHFWGPFPALSNKTRLASSGADIAVMAGSAMTVSQIRHGVSWLRSRDVEAFDGDNYVLYVHPWVADVIMQDPSWKTWNAPQQVTNTMYRGEVGKVQGARVVQSNTCFRYVYSAAPLTTASGAFNASLLLGKGAYAVTELTGAGQNQQGFDIIMHENGGTSDPADLFKTIAGKMTMTAAITNKSSGAVIATTDKVASSGT